MKAVFVIDVDKDELGKAFATITAEENGISFFARGVIRPLPKKKVPYFDPNDSTYDEERERSIMNEIDGYNRCIDELLGEAE